MLSPPSDDPRRSTILTLARRKFMQDGYAATRMEPIAREANVSTATLYGYFPGKTELFNAVIDDASKDFGGRMDGVRAAAEGDARSQLILFMTAYADFMGDPFVRAVFRLVVAERPRFRDVAMGFFEKGRNNFGAPLIELLVAKTKAGELKVDKPSWAAGELMGMVEHPVFFVPMVTGDEVKAARTTADIAAHAVETFLTRYGA